MIIGRAAVFVLVFLFLGLSSKAQDEYYPQIEEDYRVTSLEEREAAVANLLAKVEEFRKSGQVIEAVRTLNRVGRFQIRMSAPEKAVTTYQEALKLLEQKPEIKTRIDSLNGLANSYDYLSRCDQSEPIANQALTLSKQNNYVPGEAEALFILSDCQNHRDHSLAIKTAQASLALWSSINRKREMADTNMVIGHYQMTQNNLVECARSMEAAFNLFRELNDTDQQAAIKLYFGLIEYRRGAWQDALAYYTQAQSMIDEKAEPYKMGQIATGLGEVFVETGMPEVALPKFHEALEYFRVTKNQRAITYAQFTVGKAHYFSGQYQEAIQSLMPARGEAESRSDTTLTAFCDDYLGRTYDALHDPGAALRYFQSALDGYSTAKNTMEVARTQALIGRVYRQQGRIQKARSNYQLALKTFRSTADHLNESAVLYAMGDLELHENNLDLAGDYLRQSIEVTEQMRRVSTSNDLAAAISSTVHERYERYIECLMQKHRAHPKQGHALTAFETSELARARSLTELLRASQSNLFPGLDPQVAEQERSLRQALRVTQDSKVAMLGRSYTREELAALDAELKKLEGDYQQLTETIQQHYPSYKQITRPVALELAQIQERVVADDQTVLLEYALGRDRSYVWAVTHNGIKSYELPAEAQVNEAAQKLYELITAKSGANSEDELKKATQELGRMVLSPLEKEIIKRRIIVVADGALHYIPFQMLTVASASDVPLVATTEVINAPSASILGQVRQETARRKAPPNTLAAFGDPVFASNYAQRKDSGGVEYVAAVQPQDGARWRQALRNIEPTGDSLDTAAIQPLFYTRRELANLQEVAGSGTLLATGFEATPETLKSTDLTKYAILHFATHGILDPKRPENSGLFLSMVNREGKDQNGFVGLQDIYGLHAPVDLVVLSACRTGLGKDVRGEGLIGLTRGFMYAGASSVVASLWKVDDEATAELMKRFYANMLHGNMPPSAALRAAQNSIREQPQWSAPYYWAAFTLQGEHLRIIKPTQRGAWQIYHAVFSVIALAGVVAIGFWWFFNRRARRATRGQTTTQP
jgi:CHAT domain-containing protein/predicted negative regulator of RcsB-dependent stress response